MLEIFTLHSQWPVNPSISPHYEKRIRDRVDRPSRPISTGIISTAGHRARLLCAGQDDVRWTLLDVEWLDRSHWSALSPDLIRLKAIQANRRRFRAIRAIRFQVSGFRVKGAKVPYHNFPPTVRPTKASTAVGLVPSQSIRNLEGIVCDPSSHQSSIINHPSSITRLPCAIH